MTIDGKGYFKVAVYGAGFVITTSLFSAAISSLTKQPSGFSPLTLKNVLKVGVASGLTAGGIVAIDEKWDVLKHIGLPKQ